MAPMNKYIWTWVIIRYVFISPGKIPGVGVYDVYFNVLSHWKSMLKVTIPFCISIRNIWEFHLLYIFTNTWYCQFFFNFSFLGVRAVIYHCVLFSIFLITQRYFAPFAHFCLVICLLIIIRCFYTFW